MSIQIHRPKGPVNDAELAGISADFTTAADTSTEVCEVLAS